MSYCSRSVDKGRKRNVGTQLSSNLIHYCTLKLEWKFETTLKYKPTRTTIGLTSSTPTQHINTNKYIHETDIKKGKCRI